MDITLRVKPIELSTYILTGQINNLSLIIKLRNKVREAVKNSNMHYKTNVKGLFTGFKTFNHDPDMKEFIDSIRNEISVVNKVDFVLHDAWGNIYKKGDEAIVHNHEGQDNFCGLLYLTEGGPGTYFPEHDITIEEKVGKYVIFHPLLQHQVNKVEKDIERITIAFNTNRYNKFGEEDED